MSDPLKKKTWIKVKQCYSLRLTSKSKYCSISLPEELDETIHGYHVDCYSKFRSVQVQTNINDSTFPDKKQYTLRSDIPNASNTTCTGLFPTTCLFCGMNAKSKGHHSFLFAAKIENTKTSRLIKSVSSDVLFAVSHGRVKTGKHMTMGLGVKSLTGSRKVINILYRMGHSISYPAIEELETQLATEISMRGTSTPDGLQRKPGLMTSLAWDKFDQNTETLSGAGTVHDTVGIGYQNRMSDSQEDVVDPPPAQQKKKERARTFVMQEKTLEPYRKKPKMSKFHYTKIQINQPAHATLLEWRDILWMLSMNTESFPLWTGWNAQLSEDHLPLHNIQYMENITLPPTQLNVV